MEMTVAGTAQDSHLIPFYALVKHQYITKSPAKVVQIERNTKKKKSFFSFISEMQPTLTEGKGTNK